MSTPRILMIAIAALSVATLWAGAKCQSASSEARASSAEVREVAAQTAAIRAAGPAEAGDGADAVNVLRRIRTAAAAAQISDQLTSVDAGQSAGGTGANSSIYLQFGSVTLSQLAAFFEQLSDGANSVTAIDLAVPQGPDALVSHDGEAWTVQITINSTMQAPPRTVAKSS